jgi:stage V sporulation protein D (sporulation-specific penicillin-binding protein)
VRKRLLKTFAVFAFFMLYLLGRLAWVQFVQGDELRSKALAQWNRGLTVQAQRGSIYSRNGALLAGSATAETIIAIPSEIDDVEGTARVLSPILEMEIDVLMEKLQMTQFEVKLKRKVDEDIAMAVKALKLPGIRTIIENKRFYPGGNLACHMLGFVGIDEGLEGLEYYYEDELKGQEGYVVYEADAQGRELPDSVQAYLPPVNGYNLVLTIDEVIQHIVEKELDRAMIDSAPEAAGVIAVDPKTGEILAMAARPDFSPENYGKYDESIWRNPLISKSFEPGSTFKLATISAALEENVVTLHDSYYCRGFFSVGGRNIRCWSAGHGSQSIKQVLWNSCNPGFMSMGTRLGKEKLFNYIHAFGYGVRTGVDLPGENAGILFDVDTMSNADLAVASFGQGNAVTPIQQVMAAAAIANKGKLMVPRLVREIRDAEGNLVKKMEPKVVRQVITAETADEIGDALAGGVETGSGLFARVDGYRVAGKTGTAEKIAPGGGYMNNVYILSYIGYGPVEDPRIAIYVFVDSVGKGPNWGGQVAGPVFKRIMAQVMQYWQIPPNDQSLQPALPEETRVPSFTNLTKEQAMEIADSQGFGLRIEGEGDLVTGQVPVAGANVPFGTTIILYTGAGNEGQEEIVVPRLEGLSLRETSELLTMFGLRLKAVGRGIALSQDPLAGTRVNAGTFVTVTFGEPGN